MEPIFATFRRGLCFPCFRESITSLSSRFVFVENHHVKLSSPPSRPARSPAKRAKGTSARTTFGLPTLPACMFQRVSVASCQIPIWLPSSSASSPPGGASVRRVSHTSHPPLPPLSPPLSTRLMVVEGHIIIPGDGRKKC